jgi:hypothetical protein
LQATGLWKHIYNDVGVESYRFIPVHKLQDRALHLFGRAEQSLYLRFGK